MYNGRPQQSGRGFRMPQMPQMAALGSGMTRWLLIAGVALVLLCACMAFTLVRGFGSGGQAATALTATAQVGAGTGGGVVKGGGLQVGQLVTATGVDASQKNRPVDQTNNFPASAPIIYAVLQTPHVPAGTTVFARWTRAGQPFEDTREIQAAQDYANTYIEFHIQPNAGALVPGLYAVQLYFNGNPGPRTQFNVH